MYKASIFWYSMLTWDHWEFQLWNATWHDSQELDFVQGVKAKRPSCHAAAAGPGARISVPNTFWRWRGHCMTCYQYMMCNIVRSCHCRTFNASHGVDNRPQDGSGSVAPGLKFCCTSGYSMSLLLSYGASFLHQKSIRKPNSRCLNFIRQCKKMCVTLWLAERLTCKWKSNEQIIFLEVLANLTRRMVRRP
jgi:hypothetical protein